MLIHFWDVETETEKKLQISGRKREITSFIRRQSNAIAYRQEDLIR